MKIDIYDFHKILLCLVYGKKVIFGVEHVCENCSLSLLCKLIPNANSNIYLCIVKGQKSCFDCQDKEICDSIVNVYLKNRDTFIYKIMEKIRVLLKKELATLDYNSMSEQEINKIIEKIILKHFK